MALGAAVANLAAAPRPSGVYGGLPLYGTPSSTPVFHYGALPQASLASHAAQPGINYQSQLANDPMLQATLSGLSAQGVTDAAQLTAARQTALARYGQIPANLSGGAAGNVNADVNQVTRDLAQQATSGGVSTVAQLARQYEQQQAADNASLAARGLLISGAVGQHANADLGAYQTSQYQAQNSLLDYLTGQNQNFLGQQAGLRSQAADASNQALQRIIAQISAGIGVGPTPQPTAAPRPSGYGGGLSVAQVAARNRRQLA